MLKTAELASIAVSNKLKAQETLQKQQTESAEVAKQLKEIKLSEEQLR